MGSDSILKLESDPIYPIHRDFSCPGPRRLRQIAPDDGFDLCPCVAIVEPRRDQRLTRGHERCLRVEDVEQRRGAKVIALLRHAKLFLAPLDGDLLDSQRLVGVPYRRDIGDYVLLLAESRLL